MPSLKCLFCQHLNPAGAIFCNDCGGQLNLQPCERCGAIDSRSARKCYKCGAEFPLPAAAGLNPLLAPTIPEKAFAYSTLDEAGAAGQEVAHPHPGLSYSPPEPQPVDDMLASETAATATVTKPRRRLPLAVILALLLVLAAALVSVYLYQGKPVQLARTQGQKQDQQQGERQAVTDLSSAPKLQAQGTVQQPATATLELEKTPSLAPPSADAAAAARPLPVTDAEVKARHDRPIDEKCPPAVATLGLCNPDTQQERH
ncbi:Double zinc ribbon [Polaromonas sp. OV174]|uniref:zinc ribbon domain-containing protein n=1 Tax=Polaromonas sp. OV174 TaxID=1855300 RepID=UPI0008E2AF57|nr:zinc ribbon domain-containing protein [Polaromonas sp. OV174]SFB68728.1 Double zinc ribbon [Polaromonas sp. OV174]